MKAFEWTKKSTVFIMATIATFMWGSAYPSVKIGYELFKVAHDDIGGKLVFAGYRFALAGLFVLIVYRATYSKDFRKTKSISKDGLKRMLRSFLLLGLMQTTLQYIFFYIGLANTSGSKGSIINASGAFFGVILAPLFYKDDRLTRKKILGCIVGFIGILILNFDGSSLGGFVLIGEGFVLMSTLMNVFASFYSKSIVRVYDVFLTTGTQLFLGGIVLLVIGNVAGGHIVFTGKGILLLIYMALISSVGFSLWTMLLKYNPASEVTIYNLLIPVFGNILSSIFLSENIFTIVNIAAIIFVSLGIVFVNIRDKAIVRQ